MDMGIIPKEGEKRENIGIIPLVIVNYLLGLGIAFIGQRMKNRYEFLGGLAFFVMVVASFFISPLLSTILGLFSWAYVIIRLIWIFVKKETGFGII